MSDLGTNAVRLFTGSRYRRVSLSRASLASCRYGVHELPRFDRATARLDVSRSVGVLHSGTGILTSYPFVALELRSDLGSTNPRLIGSAEEPLLVRPSGFTPDSRCYCGQDCRSLVGPRELSPALPPDRDANLLGHTVTCAARSRRWT